MGHRWAAGSFVVAGAVLLAAAPAAHGQVPAPADVTATKTVSGTFEEGGTVSYVVTLHNDGGIASPDNATDEFVDVLPAQLTLVSATATGGIATIDVLLNQVKWNGAITIGTDIVITINATVGQGTEGDDVVNQGTVSFDGDNGGDNDSTALTDGDAVLAGEQATVFQVAAIAPTVTIEQALTQPDPAGAEPVVFTATFSEPVTGFDGADVQLSGTAGPSAPAVTGSGTTYTVSVTGATGPGTVIASVVAGAAADDDGITSLVSTSNDNQVTLTAIGIPTSTTTSSSTSTSILGAGSTTTTAAVGAGGLARTGNDDDSPLVAFLGYWLALGGIGAVALAGWQRRRARTSS